MLPVQFDAQARVERALDHPLARNFEHTRGSEPTHQRLPHAVGVAPIFDASSSAPVRSANALAWSGKD